MNEFLKNVLVILISVALSIQWCNLHFEKRCESPKQPIQLNLKDTMRSPKIISVTNYFTITNYVTVTNFIEQSTNALSPGIPLQTNTQSVSSVEINPPTENETRLRQIAKELTDLLDNIKIKE